MAKFDFKLEENPNTGESMYVSSMQGELISIASVPIANSSANSSLFYPATVQYEDAKGNIKKSGCLVYEKNFNYGMSVGSTYLGKIIITKDKPLPLLVLSHLDRASNATMEDFGFDISLLEVTDFDVISKK
jgi:hypothetical protein